MIEKINAQLSKKILIRKKMANLNWCLKQKKGIRLIEPNDNLSKEYIREADSTLEAIQNINNKWDVIMGYYAAYSALYSILMKAGIKSEIHECSISLMEKINDFSEDDINFIRSLKEDRIKVQYYLKEKRLEDRRRLKDFILKCKSIKEETSIEALRSAIKKGD